MVRIKITGGNLKGRAITVPENKVARYTSSKVREAIFAIIGDVTGLRILDLFAGSGSFTIEALSRGAVAATCVEKDKRMSDTLNKNLSALSLDKDCLVLNMDVRYAMPFLYKRASNYDIIFMDPPYEQDFIPETMALLQKNVIYHKDTMFILEYSKRESLLASLKDGWNERTNRRYGDTIISFISVADRGEERQLRMKNCELKIKNDTRRSLS